MSRCSVIVLLTAFGFLTANCAMGTAASGVSTDFSKSVTSLIRSGKLADAGRQIGLWEKADPSNPDLAVAKANLILSNPDARDSVVLESTEDGATGANPDVGPRAYTILDAKTSKPVGYIGAKRGESAQLAQATAIEILSEAETTYPERLDIRFGIIALQAKLGDYKKVLAGLKTSVAYAKSVGFHGLKWMENVPVQDAEIKLADAIHVHYGQYSSGAHVDDKLSMEFAHFLTEAFPNDVRGWNDLGREYSEQHNLQKSLECMQKASELDPKDSLVLMNTAHIYILMDKKVDAINCYQKVIELNNDDEIVEAAKESLKELNTKSKN